MTRKLFAIGFCIMFLSTAILCMITKQPLIFLPVNYGSAAFLKFALLVGVLCILLVFINLPVLKFLKNATAAGTRDEAFYFIGTIVILQLATMLIGYTESALTRRVNASFFYYYKGVGNSLTYVFTGNLTAGIIASLYAKEQTRRKQVERETRLELSENIKNE